MTPSPDSNIIPFPRPAGQAGALRLRVDLLLMPVPVWRRLLLPPTASFWDLHVAIQDAFGWEDRHLHRFTLDEPRTGRRLRFGIPDESGFHGVHDILAGWDHQVAPYLAVGGHPVLYTYDFGDDWQHEVVFEGRAEDDPQAVLPRCLAGEGPCPPEDSGGPQMCAALLDGADPAFDPDSVVFDNPRLRWERAFGKD